MKKSRKILLIISWVLFGLTSSLIIVESCIPSDKSGEHSFSFSTIAAKIVNIFSKPKKVITADPSELKISNNDPSATVDGVKTSIVSSDKAVVGTTKLYTYNLSYSKEADVYNSDVNFKCLVSPGENSYSSTISSSTKNGTIRIIPLQEGHYSFELKDKSNHIKTFEFDATDRVGTSSISSSIATLTLDKGECKYFPYAFTFGDLNRTDTSTDHYLQRFYDRKLTDFSSSDESIFTVNNGGIIKGISDGTANLLFKGESVCSVTVNNSVFVSEVDHITLTSESTDISPLDFDYPYGSQLNVHYFDVLNNEIVSTEPVKFSSDNYLIAMVDNDHQEKVNDELVNVDGGFVSGYRNLGKTSIRAELCSDSSISTSIEFESKKVNPTSATITAKSGTTVLSTDQTNSIAAGSTINLSKTYTPLNASNTELKVEVSDSSKLEVQNNNTNSPSINLVGVGDCSFSVYMPSIGESSKVTYNLTIIGKKAIEDKDMNKFAQLVRKGVGHFALFFADGVFAFVALSLTFFDNKKWWMKLLINSGIALASGFSLAGISELIQSIPKLNRGSSWSDVAIDFVGFTFAIIIGVIVYLVIHFITESKSKKKKE